MQNKLRLIGVRPINNIVDITNYILHAYGQPMHCFDADKIKGGKIVVKTCAEGTKFVTLDEAERTLSERDLMICNAEEPMCIAGVFGGLDSGTTESTKDVFLESAYFHPTWVRKTARRHGLSTDSSFRFERGIDPNGVIYALKEAALLVKELAGGEIASEIKDNYPAPIADFAVELSYDYVNSLIGKVIPAETVKSIVSSLEMKIVEETAEGLSLLVPPYRVDVQRPCDVVEDILRIYGYNNVEIPTSVKSSLSVKGEVDKSVKLQACQQPHQFLPGCQAENGCAHHCLFLILFMCHICLRFIIADRTIPFFSIFLFFYLLQNFLPHSPYSDNP